MTASLTVQSTPASEAIALAPAAVASRNTWDDMYGIGIKGVALSRYLPKEESDGSTKLIAVPTDFQRIQHVVTDVQVVEIGEGEMRQVKLNVLGHPVRLDHNDRPVADTSIVRLITCGAATVAGRSLMTILSGADLSHPINLDVNITKTGSGYTYASVRGRDLITQQSVFDTELHEDFKEVSNKHSVPAGSSKGQTTDIIQLRNEAYVELIEEVVRDLQIPLPDPSHALAVCNDDEIIDV